ncbi:MAG: tetratricopeptide repeat protein [Magnetococcales bacterium]|nr:tetratricopeptide repeat protein [Magnetococcales bacterium]
MHQERLDNWLRRFAQDPRAVWDDVVRGRVPVPGYEQADLAETLSMVFGGLPKEHPHIKLLDTTMTQWVDEFLAWSAEERHHFGFSRHVFCLVQGARGAGYLQLPEFARHVRTHLPRYRSILPVLQLAPSRDPLLAFYQVLSGSPVHAPQLPALWHNLCSQADDLLPGYYLHIGLQGLRQCPGKSAATQPPWISGLLAWLPHAPSEKDFIRKFRALRAMYPQKPETWRRWLEPILDQSHPVLAGVSRERIEWWAKEVLPSKKGSQARKSKAQHLRSPDPDDLQIVLDKYLQGRDFTALTDDLKNLFSRHEDFVTKTGNTDFFVRAVSVAARTLLCTSNRQTTLLSLRLLQRALELEPWNGISWNLYGRAMRVSGRVEVAEWIFWEAIRRDPNNLSNYTELARLLVNQGRPTEAEALFREAMRIDPRDIHSRTELGRLLVNQDRLPEAEALFREAMRIDPQHVHSRTELGRLLARQNKINEARDMFNEILDIDKNNPYARNALKSLKTPPEMAPGEIFLEHLVPDAPEEIFHSGEEPLENPLLDFPGMTTQADEKSLHEAHFASHQIHMQNAQTNQQNMDLQETLLDAWHHEALRPAACAKQADFRLDVDGPQSVELQAIGREQLLDLLQTNSQNSIVIFFGQRHGLLATEGRTVSPASPDSPAWQLEAALQEENWRERVQDLSKGFHGYLNQWLRLAAGETDLWNTLRREEKTRSSSVLDQRVLSEINRFKRSDMPPSHADLRSSLRRIAASTLQGGTDRISMEATQ